MSDITERLDAHYNATGEQVLLDAIAEIERLRAALLKISGCELTPYVRDIVRAALGKHYD